MKIGTQETKRTASPILRILKLGRDGIPIMRMRVTGRIMIEKVAEDTLKIRLSNVLIRLAKDLSLANH